MCYVAIISANTVMAKGGRAQSFWSSFALLALCMAPGRSPGLATGQLSTKSPKCKYDRKLPCVVMANIVLARKKT